jgi:hypothetical protein
MFQITSRPPLPRDRGEDYARQPNVTNLPTSLVNGGSSPKVNSLLLYSLLARWSLLKEGARSGSLTFVRHIRRRLGGAWK